MPSDPRAEPAAPPPQIGGLIGSYGCVAPLAYLGRKKTLLWANLFVFLSSALMFFGEVWWVLLLGRVSIGVVAGVAQMVAGSYMTEIAPIAIRGSVGVCSQVLTRTVLLGACVWRPYARAVGPACVCPSCKRA